MTPIMAARSITDQGNISGLGGPEQFLTPVSCPPAAFWGLSEPEDALIAHRGKSAGFSVTNTLV
jgi:hypothetical protein